jgi:photosystem II stability/assembly factor-like uncharacterized protein
MRSVPIAVLLTAVLSIAGLPTVSSGPLPLGWEQLPLTQRVLRLDATQSGALFARTTDELLRSDDGGMTWSPVVLPPRPTFGQAAVNAVAVDPTDQTALFAAGQAGIYRSVGEPVSWTVSLATSIPVLRIAVSAADPMTVYAALAQGSGSFQVWRSDDRGASWSQIEGPLNGSICIWEAPLLAPHVSLPDVAFGSWTCMAGRELSGGGRVLRSQDRGLSWTEVFRRSTYFPSNLATTPGNPTRVYLIENRGAAPGDGFLARSNDGGATWTTIFESDMDESLGGLAVHPAEPDVVVVGTRAQSGDGRVWISKDAGATWDQIASPDLGSVQSLAFSADGAYLYAATFRGVFRQSRL